MPPAERMRSRPPDARLVQSLPSVLADVILPRHLHRVFTYRIPLHLHGAVKVGSQVRVPFGATDLVGLVVTVVSGDARPRHETRTFQLRDIHAVVDEPETGMPPELLHVARLVSNYYVSPQGQTIRLIVPPRASTATRYVLTESGRRVCDDAESLSALSSTAQRLVLRLSRRPQGLTLATLRRTVDRGISRPLSMLRRQGCVETREGAPVGRPADAPSPSLSIPLPRAQSEASSSEERVWWEQVTGAFDAGHADRFLLIARPEERRHRMMRAIEAVLTRHRQALLVAPDIGTVEAMAATVKGQWGARAEVFHGALTPAVRRERWHRIRCGSSSIVLGTRSAVFAPLTNIGLIWIDDEEDAALKEETEPHYHAREVGWMRAEMHKAVMVLGSGQPTLETLYRNGLDSSSPGKKARPGMRPSTLRLTCQRSPVIETVDLRSLPFGTLLSETMTSGIVAAVGARTPAILFLNRKGFAPALLCRDCGNTPQCGHCSVSLTFYKGEGRLSCHYCGTALPLPDTCPTCRAPKLEPRGIGTEAVEERVRRLVPRARIGRIDRDTCRTPKQAAGLRRRFIDGELDVLIGTQMLLHGPPMPPAAFVGLVQADAGLHLPDFRAGEQTYRTLSQAVALCHDQEHEGRVVLQTFLPAHYVIEAVRTQNPAHFYDQELAFRRALAYPPFSHLISLQITGPSAERTQAAAERWAAILKRLAKHSGPVIWGPIPSPVSRLRDRYRWQIVVKSDDAEAARRLVATTLQEVERASGRGGLRFHVDVDPLAMA